MKRRGEAWPILLVLSGVLGAVPLATEPVTGQTVVVTSPSVGKLADDLEHVLKAVAPDGDPGAQAGLDTLRRFKEGDLIKGLDKTRLFGIAITMPEKQGDAPQMLAAVPVIDFGQFLESLKGLGMKVEENPGISGFSHRVSTPDGDRTVFALQSRQYAFFSLIPAGADRIKSVDPVSWKSKAGDGSVLALTLRLSKLPDALKDQFINGLEASLAQQKDRRPDEPEAEYKSRMVTTRLGKAAIESLVREGETLELGLNLDRGHDELSMDLVASARPGTAMADNLHTFSKQRSRFAWLGSASPLAAWVSLPIPKELRDVLAELIDQNRKDEEAKAKTDVEKAFAGKVSEILKQNFTAGEVDLGFALQGPYNTSSGAVLFGLIGGVEVKDGKEFERLARDALANQPPDPDVKVTFDVAKGDDGTPVHQLVIAESKLDADMLKKMGKSPVFFAFPRNAVVVSLGEGGVKAIQQGLGKIAREPPGVSTEPAALHSRLSLLGELADQNPDAVRKIAGDVFQGANASRDGLRLSFKSQEQAIRLQLAVDVPALKFAVRMGQKRAAQPQPK